MPETDPVEKNVVSPLCRNFLIMDEQCNQWRYGLQQAQEAAR
jgi:hypothetical protein